MSKVPTYSVVLDSDILVLWLKGDVQTVAHLKTLIKTSKIYASTISYAEIISLSKSDELPFLTDFFSFVEILPMDKQVSELAGKMMRSGKMNMSSALEAATVVRYGMRLWTGNRKWYKNLEDGYLL